MRRKTFAVAMFGLSFVGLCVGVEHCWRAWQQGLIQPMSLAYNMSTSAMLGMRDLLLVSLGGLILAWLLYPKAERPAA